MHHHSINIAAPYPVAPTRRWRCRQRVGLAALLAWQALAAAQPVQPTASGTAPSVDPGQLVGRPLLIDATTPAPAQALVGALKAGRSVTLCNVDIDMTGFAAIDLESGQSLRAAAGCERSATRLGPRIFVTGKREGGVALFVVRDSNVVMTGFRLQGPTAGIGSGTEYREYGIQVAPNPDAKPPAAGSAPPAPSHLLQGVAIHNMEIFHWSGAGIDLVDTQAVHPLGRMTLANAGGVLIENNYIHHNRHFDGFGYGVNVGRGAYAQVRANVFEQNRHAIAGNSVSVDGNDFSGYLFQDNLILPGGGLHCTETSLNVCWQTHQIDMHGTKSETLNGEHCCGVAGETMLIERNTILYRGGYRRVGVGALSKEIWEWGLALKIRGNPKGRVLVDGNVFALDNRGSAIAQNGDGARLDANGRLLSSITNPIQVTPNNLWGAKPLEQLKTCDFDGDRVADQFMATGVSWWVRSGATGQWRYLGTHTEQAGALAVRDVDGDGRCDVVRKGLMARPDQYSPRGTGPWLTVGSITRAPARTP